MLVHGGAKPFIRLRWRGGDKLDEVAGFIGGLGDDGGRF
jgi:hypothetical protein